METCLAHCQQHGDLGTHVDVLKSVVNKHNFYVDLIELIFGGLGELRPRGPPFAAARRSHATAARAAPTAR
eukprot:6183739-Pleurochrysis_carterae.AAC.2